ncbi:hypothetical protein U9M48_030238, partial [Paspalum notatum var. saurae]
MVRFAMLRSPSLANSSPEPRLRGVARALQRAAVPNGRQWRPRPLLTVVARSDLDGPDPNRSRSNLSQIQIRPSRCDGDRSAPVNRGTFGKEPLPLSEINPQSYTLSSPWSFSKPPPEFFEQQQENPEEGKLKALFAWPKLKASVISYVQACQVCQQAKIEHLRLPGLLQPLPVPEQSWATINMDFIEGLPKSGKFDVTLVMVDKFTKYAHFIPRSHPFTALSVAQEFLNTVYRLHGLPQAITTDRNRIFTSNLWQELFRLTDTKLLMSSSYHPKTDGQTERLNQCLEAFLRCTVHSCPRQMDLVVTTCRIL